MTTRLLTRRNIAMICVFLDLDRAILLPALRQLARTERTTLLTGLLLEAARY